MCVTLVLVVCAGCGDGSGGSKGVGDPQASNVVVASGVDAAGGRFRVVVNPSGPGKGPAGGCANPIVFESSDKDSYTECMSSSRKSSGPEVLCDEPWLTIIAPTLLGTRDVRLRLSDGRTIISSAIVVPPRLGGPVGFYYQVVRGPRPVPVSLTEIDQHGRVLRTVETPRVVECTSHAVKTLPNGIRTLVRGRVPSGPVFTITGEHVRFLGQNDLNLKLGIEEQGKPGPDGGGSGELSTSSKERSALAVQLFTGCAGNAPYAIVYGLLRKRGYAVLVSAPGHVGILRHLASESLRAGNEVVYVVVPWIPRKVVVKTSHGKVVQSENYAGLPGLHCPGGQGATVGTIG